MILLIQINNEKLHFNEFVKPVGDILVKNNFKGFIRHYACLTKKDLDKADKIIICGTSLKDNQFVKNLDKFSWIKDYKKPALGICGGAQIIHLIFGAELKKKTEIGFFDEDFKKDFLGLKNKQQVYHLHNNYTTLPKGFKKYTNSKIPQATNKDNFYTTLFHPEVRNKELILNFCKK